MFASGTTVSSPAKIATAVRTQAAQSSQRAPPGGCCFPDLLIPPFPDSPVPGVTDSRIKVIVRRATNASATSTSKTSVIEMVRPTRALGSKKKGRLKAIKVRPRSGRGRRARRRRPNNPSESKVPGAK